MRLLGPGDKAMIAGAVAQARAAGVSEAMIQRVIEQEAAGRNAFRPAVVAARLYTLARQRQQPAPGE